MGQIIDGAFYSDYDGQEIDRRLAIAGGVSNINLLDNAWFTVNQRGVTTLTSGFISDRWKIYNGTGVVNADKTITFTATQSDAVIYQTSPYRNDIVDKVVTLSIMYNDYTVESGTVTVAASGWRGFTLSSGIYLALDTINNKVQFVIGVPNGTTVTIRAVKLEAGSVSTLANDVAPNYGIELYKCKAYFQRIYFTSAWRVVTLGFCETATSGSATLNLSAPLRTIDNVIFSYSGSFILYNGVISIPVTNITKTMNTPDNVTLSCTATDLTPGTFIALITSTDGSYIDLSVDL